MKIKFGGSKTVDLTEPKRSDFSDNLGGAVEYTITHFVFSVIKFFGYDLVGYVKAWFEALFDNATSSLVNIARPVLDDIKEVPGLPPRYKEMLNKVTGTEPITLVSVALMAILGVIGGLISGIVAPISRLVSQWIDAGVETARADPSVAFPMQWRVPALTDELTKHVKQKGWNETIIDGWEEVLRPHLGLAELLTLWKRGVITDANVNNALKAFGWKDKDIPYLKELQSLIPGPGDLVSMAVREAFSDEIAKRFGYDEAFPADFAYWCEKQGLSAEWARRYWRAHWTLPSTSAGYEMLHRGVIDEDTLKLLLVTADIPAFWRDKLMQISYANYTRVDIRRMYQTGVFTTPEEVLRAYMDIGYDENKALKLTEFTLREYGEETREASKGDVLVAYELGRLEYDEAVELLGKIDYPKWIAEAYLARIDLKRANRLANDLIKSVKTLYINGQITRTDVVSKLSTIPLPSVEIDRYTEEWDISRKAKTKRPTRTDLRKMFLTNILDEDDYRLELKGHGLSPKYIDWYVDQSKLELAEQMRREAEAAQKEADRLLVSATRTDLDVALSQLDVRIAQANVAMADIKLSMLTDMSWEDTDKAKSEIYEYKVMIAEYRKEKADLRKEFLEQKQKEV